MVYIQLGQIQDVKEFVNIIIQIDGDFDLALDRYVVDAKSIMGILSLDLSKKLQLRIETSQEDVLEKIKKFIVQ